MPRHGATLPRLSLNFLCQQKRNKTKQQVQRILNSLLRVRERENLNKSGGIQVGGKQENLHLRPFLQVNKNKLNKF